ncbi:MAG: Holliday junction helicase, RuvB subunit [Firmicutes bacterium]|nr:Holliday junction helicase, RuvB subunit [Bacillota bacterium]
MWEDGAVNQTIAREALNRLDVDPEGLDQIDQKALKTIIMTFAGGPVGLETLAATIGEESVTLEDVVEPFLLQMGFLQRTPRGRMATARAYQHLGFSLPQSRTDNGLFPE